MVKIHNKFIAVILTIVILVSNTNIFAFAATSTSKSFSDSHIDLLNKLNSTRIKNVDLNGFKTKIKNSDILPVSQKIKNYKMVQSSIMDSSINHAPVADLEPVILNEDSLKNGQVTTQTQIAWLWAYNDQNFTYDPDGDAIVNKNLGGITQDDIISDLNQDNQYIGFVTQFATAAEYILTFQVTDARGALSNVYSIIIDVEPIDNNTRPICQVQYSSDTVDNDHLEYISCDTSYDNDSGDTISKSRGVVYNQDGTSSDLNNYVVSKENNSYGLLITKPGIYEIRMSICDNHGAWSNWASFMLTVNSVNSIITNIDINYDIGKPIESGDNSYWVDYRKSIELAKNAAGNDGESVFNQVKSRLYPDALPKKKIGTIDVAIKGTVLNTDGTPRQNAIVKIKMPMTLNTFLDYAVTDANGNFDYYCRSTKYDIILNPNSVPEATGDSSGLYIDYAYLCQAGGTIFYYKTKLEVSSGSAVYSDDVAACAGAKLGIFLGNRWEFKAPENSSVKQWIEY